MFVNIGNAGSYEKEIKARLEDSCTKRQHTAP